jgi:hypothetical protein
MVLNQSHLPPISTDCFLSISFIIIIVFPVFKRPSCQKFWMHCPPAELLVQLVLTLTVLPKIDGSSLKETESYNENIVMNQAFIAHVVCFIVTSNQCHYLQQLWLWARSYSQLQNHFLAHITNGRKLLLKIPWHPHSSIPNTKRYLLQDYSVLCQTLRSLSVITSHR